MNTFQETEIEAMNDDAITLVSDSVSSMVIDDSELTKKSQSFLQDPETRLFLEELASLAEDDVYALFTRFQNSIEISVEMFSIEDLLNASQLQLQYDIIPGRVSSILTDAKSGLLNTLVLLNPPEVCNSISGKLKFLGGHHRLAALIKLLVDGGASMDAILNQKVQCVVKNVNTKILEEELSESDAITLAEKLEALMWLSSNGSRAVTAEETRDYAFARLGLDKDNPQQILDAHFGRKRISFSDAVKMAFETMFYNSIDELVIDGNHYELRPQTVSNIIASFFNNLKGVTDTFQVMTRKGRLGEPMKEPKEFKIWAADLKTAETVYRILENIVNEQMLQDALGSWLRTDGVLSENIARASSEIGRLLATIYNGAYEPEIQPWAEPVVSTKKPKASGLLGKARLR